MLRLCGACIQIWQLELELILFPLEFYEISGKSFVTETLFRMPSEHWIHQELLYKVCYNPFSYIFKIGLLDLRSVQEKYSII